MGASKSHQTKELFEKDWKCVAKNWADGEIWVNKAHPTKQLQKYGLHLNDMDDLKHERTLYQLRQDSLYLVAGLHFEQEINEEFCSSTYKGEIYVERIPVRISNMEDIPYPDILHLYNNALHGFKQLLLAVGEFAITEEMIGISQDNVTKVWMSSHYGKSTPDSSLKTQADMLQGLLSILERNIDEATLPRGVMPIAKFIGYNLTSFDQAISRFNEYCKRFFNGCAPNRLECIDKAGGIDALTHFIESNTARKALEEHNNQLHQQNTKKVLSFVPPPPIQNQNQNQNQFVIQKQQYQPAQTMQKHSSYTSLHGPPAMFQTVKTDHTTGLDPSRSVSNLTAVASINEGSQNAYSRIKQSKSQLQIGNNDKMGSHHVTRSPQAVYTQNRQVWRPNVKETREIKPFVDNSKSLLSFQSDKSRANLVRRVHKNPNVRQSEAGTLQKKDQTHSQIMIMNRQSHQNQPQSENLIRNSRIGVIQIVKQTQNIRPIALQTQPQQNQPISKDSIHQNKPISKESFHIAQNRPISKESFHFHPTQPISKDSFKNPEKSIRPLTTKIDLRDQKNTIEKIESVRIEGFKQLPIEQKAVVVQRKQDEVYQSFSTPVYKLGQQTLQSHESLELSQSLQNSGKAQIEMRNYESKILEKQQFPQLEKPRDIFQPAPAHTKLEKLYFHEYTPLVSQQSQAMISPQFIKSPEKAKVEPMSEMHHHHERCSSNTSNPYKTRLENAVDTESMTSLSISNLVQRSQNAYDKPFSDVKEDSVLNNSTKNFYTDFITRDLQSSNHKEIVYKQDTFRTGNLIGANYAQSQGNEAYSFASDANRENEDSISAEQLLQQLKTTHAKNQALVQYGLNLGKNYEATYNENEYNEDQQRSHDFQELKKSYGYQKRQYTHQQRQYSNDVRPQSNEPRQYTNYKSTYQNSPQVPKITQLAEQRGQLPKLMNALLQDNLEMKYSMTHVTEEGDRRDPNDQAYRVDWDPQILADMQAMK